MLKFEKMPIIWGKAQLVLFLLQEYDLTHCKYSEVSLFILATHKYIWEFSQITCILAANTAQLFPKWWAVGQLLKKLVRKGLLVRWRSSLILSCRIPVASPYSRQGSIVQGNMYRWSFREARREKNYMPRRLPSPRRENWLGQTLNLSTDADSITIAMKRKNP